MLIGEADRENGTFPELIQQGFVTCKDGVLAANFPVFTAEIYKKVQELIAPIAQLPLSVWGVRV